MLPSAATSSLAKNGGPRELPHQRLCEFREGIAQNDDLRQFAQFVEKCPGSFERGERADDLLDVRQLQAVSVQNVQAALHQHIVVRLVSSGAAQFRDAGFLRKSDPDFRDENAFEAERDDGLGFHWVEMSWDRRFVQCGALLQEWFTVWQVRRRA